LIRQIEKDARTQLCMYVCCTEGMRALPMLVKTGGPEKLI